MMPFVSFAQNQEDVTLWRALGAVEHGFYVDVGAADPTEDSVTRAFYDRGWSGINVEPLEEYYTRLVAARPRDVTLRVLAGSHSGVRTFYVLPGTGLSSIDPGYATRNATPTLQVREEVLPVMPLANILQSHGDAPIHFLKIDVEGAEREVLEGIDFAVTRPWIIVVEATEPNSQVRTQSQWDYILLGHGYEFAQFDGLNCFYVACEHPELKERIALPPNVFDDFRRASEQALIDKSDHVDREIQRMAEVERNYAELRAALPDLQQWRKERNELSRRVEELEAKLGSAAEREATLIDEVAESHRSRIAMAKQLGISRAELLKAFHEIESRETLLAQARKEISVLTSDLTTAIAQRLRLNDGFAAIESHAEDLRYRLTATLRSDSWRMTAPVRKASVALRRLLGRPTDGVSMTVPPPPRVTENPQASAHASNAASPSVSPAEISRRANIVLDRLNALRRRGSST